ncbi:MAG: A24 family peptidase [Chloroflexota bacterium]
MLEWVWLVVACSFFAVIALIDLRSHRVPNKLVYPAMGVALLVHAVPPGRETLNTLLGGVIGLAPFLLVALLRPGGMGGGDVKLAALTGLTAGFPQAAWAISIAILLGGVTAMALLVTRRGRLDTGIPYAPFLCLGAILALLL